MTLLQSMDGKYYDVPEDQATSFEIPRDKVKELLANAGPPPSPQGAPGNGRRGGPPMGGPGGAPVIIQVLPNGIHGPAAAPAGPPASAEREGSPEQTADVDPYWWWRNMSYGPWWGNRWMNW